MKHAPSVGGCDAGSGCSHTGSTWGQHWPRARSRATLSTHCSSTPPKVCREGFGQATITQRCGFCSPWAGARGILWQGVDEAFALSPYLAQSNRSKGQPFGQPPPQVSSPISACRRQHCAQPREAQLCTAHLEWDAHICPPPSSCAALHRANHNPPPNPWDSHDPALMEN